ncbi:hypothetical protein CEUSTIGMA_g2344.t1 [Chlamydomonas eustigma]|uniref:DNA-directed DNA polymerase X domain-containing protein n=1 Tax=Chlamydomonas eustigma TaxID=1157962 RepID=A0A250WVP6_9CHLO|nr:hypothetical protein CEUSTIGMA_g2344.t1 [Chlamydomonas eustigma]|eukprot:GAX74898.1 hypothetical protein CEUSTIGMA_g2344.t1 [Chlamydomonas eustigma]
MRKRMFVIFKENFTCFQLGSSRPFVVLGRGTEELRILSLNISREHVRVQLDENQNAVTIIPLKRPVFILRQGPGVPQKLQCSEHGTKLYPGDHFFLEQSRDGRLCHGFLVSNVNQRSLVSSIPSDTSIKAAQPSPPEQLSNKRKCDAIQSMGNKARPDLTSLQDPTAMQLAGTSKTHAGFSTATLPVASSQTPATVTTYSGLHADGEHFNNMNPARSPVPESLLSTKISNSTTSPSKKRIFSDNGRLYCNNMTPQSKRNNSQSVNNDNNIAKEEGKLIGILSGLAVCFWTTAHTKVLQGLLQKAGAKVQGIVCPSTTHVVLSHDALTADEVAARVAKELHLSSTVSGQTSKSPASRFSQQLCGHADISDASPAFRSCGDQKGGRNLVFQSHNHVDYLSKGKPQTMETKNIGEMELVTPLYFSESLAQGILLPSVEYKTKLQLSLQDHSVVTSSHEGERSCELAPYRAKLAERENSKDEVGLAASSGSVRHINQKDAIEGMREIMQDVTDAGTGPEEGIKVDETSAATCHVKGSPVIQQQVLHGYLIPGPEDICSSTELWGVDNKWVEPWDENLAQDTLSRLNEAWRPFSKARAMKMLEHQQHPNAVTERHDTKFSDSMQPAHSSRHAAEGFDLTPNVNPATNSAEIVPSDVASSSRQQLINRTCMHTACCVQTFCFIIELKRVLKSYVGGSKDQFKKKAVQQAINVMEVLSEPIRAVEDVDRLLWKLGDKTREKVCDILLGEGTYWRNEIRSKDERLRALSSFMEVWGAGETTAISWYNQGCRNIVDVAALKNLTSMQRVGIKYYHDFLKRIPRLEVAEAEQLIREVFLDILVEKTGVGRTLASQQCHVRAMGSYLSGRKDTSDIDILLAPSPAAVEAAGLTAPHTLAPSALLQAVLNRLREQGWVTRDSEHFGAASPKFDEDRRCGNYAPSTSLNDSNSSATFLGVWKGPSSPCARRLDIKVYPLEVLPFAVTHFGSGSNFNRALRYFCKVGGAAQGAAAAAVADGKYFRLSDLGMTLRISIGPQVPVTEENGETVVCGPSVSAKNETDIFNALGLHYVPPHLRHAMREDL